MTALEQIRSAIAAASRSSDPTLRVVYVAAARMVIDRVRAELDEVEALVVAQEAELVRLRGTGQLDLEAAP